MLNFIIFILSTIGATLIITQSYLFKNLREKLNNKNKKIGKLFSCSQCMGFHIGLIVQFIIILNIRKEFIFYWYDFNIILYGFIGSFVSYLTYLLIKPLINKYD